MSVQSLVSLFVCCFFYSNNARSIFSFFFFNDTATTEIYTLSLHDRSSDLTSAELALATARSSLPSPLKSPIAIDCGLFRSEEHTSELQSQSNLVCRLLLEKKKNNRIRDASHCEISNTISPLTPPQFQ